MQRILAAASTIGALPADERAASGAALARRDSAEPADAARRVIEWLAARIAVEVAVSDRLTTTRADRLTLVGAGLIHASHASAPLIT